MAGVVADTFNMVLDATGGRLADPSAITTGNYGMRKSDFVYRPTSTRDKRAITYRVSSKNNDSAFSELTGYGIWKGLTDPDFQIIGGSNYIKRAAYATFELGGMNATNFDQAVLLGNISSAQSYEAYLANSAVINAIIAGEPDSVFAAETALTLVRAEELGLTRRHRSDWFGGFNGLLEEGQANAAKVDFGFDYDPLSDQLSRLVGVGDFVLGDTIDIAAQVSIERPDGEATTQIIDLRSGQLADQTGFLVNGELQDGIAAAGADYDAVTNVSRSMSGSNLRAHAAITTDANTAGESVEQLRIVLGDGSNSYLQRSQANVTIVDSSDKAYLLVGRAYAAEADGHLTWRVSLSKAATSSVTLSLALSENGAEAGSDYNDSLQVSANGVSGWTTAGSLTLGPGVTEYFVRVPITADNTLNPTYDPYEFDVDGLVIPGSGNGEREFNNVEGNEKLILSAEVTSGAQHLQNGDQTIAGLGTIVDGSNDDPLVWIDDVIVHEGSMSSASIARSRADGTSTVTYSTVDNRQLEIPVAATVDAGGGDDTVHASDLGDNILGGDGNDTLYGGRLDDWLLGGDGNDILDAGAQASGLGGDGNYLDGGAGNDTLKGREGSDWLDGGDGEDDLNGGAGGDILTGGAGDNDELFGGAGDDTYLLRLGDGADVVTEFDPTAGLTQSENAFLTWDSSQDQFLENLNSTVRTQIESRFNASALLNVGAFSGFVAGQYAMTSSSGSGLHSRDWFGYYTPGVSDRSIGGGDDSVVLGQGISIGDVRLRRSEINGAAGDDLIIEVVPSDGSAVQDSLTLQNWFSNPFDRIEWLKFADGNEIRIGDFTSFVNGTNGNDTLIGTLGNDFVFGGGGDDTLYLLAGDDIGNGGSGADVVSGDSGDDLIVGGSGRDSITGEAGNDTLSGDGGDDEIYGGDGNDLISGGRGNDWLVGGAGNDIFKYSRGDGRDVVVDELAGTWATIWTAAGDWAPGYDVASDGTITAPDGFVLRENVGTSSEPSLRWNGRLEYDSLNETLRFFTPTGGNTIVSDQGSDTIEFDPTIHLKDLVLERGGDDLIVHISSDEGASGAFNGEDSIRIRDWFSSYAPRSIEKFAFFSTGILDLTSTTIVAGTAGDDAALGGSSGVDWITGGLGDDTVSGSGGDDILSGNGGIDTIDGGTGDDVIYGGDGDDILQGGAGADILIGGAGSDWASYEEEAIGVEINLASVDLATGAAQGDSFSSIENLKGGSGNDELGGDSGENILEGGAGNDILSAGAGDDTYVWEGLGDGQDIIREGQKIIETAVDANGNISSEFQGYWKNVGSTTINNGTGEPDPGTIWEYRIREIAGNEDVFIHANRVTRVEGLGPPPNGLSTYPGGWRNGFVQPDASSPATREIIDTSEDGGEDTLELGLGIQFQDLAFSQSNQNLIIQHSSGSQVEIEGHFAQATGAQIEFLQFHDGLSARLDNLKFGSGGGSEDDLILSTSNVTQLSGNDGDDVIFGGSAANVIYGGSGDDVIEGGAGADTLYGQAGANDTVRYAGSTQAVQVNLGIQAQSSTGDASGDVLSGFENVQGSWTGSDTLIGDAGDNRLFGFGGGDYLSGNGGADVLVGDDGNDQLLGGSGEDNLSGGAGDDHLQGGTDNDLLNGGDGHDKLEGGDGNDTLIGGAGNERTFGSFAGYIWGGRGDDILDGGAGIDDLRGGEGNDTLIGGIGDDVLYGDQGDDVFVFGRDDGADALLDSVGLNSLVFNDGITSGELWITRESTARQDLLIGVIGGDTFLRVNGNSQIEKIVTADGSLFLGEGKVNDLINAMSLEGAATPDEMPEQFLDQIEAAWSPTETPAPRAPDTPQRVLVTTLSANAFNNDLWPRIAPTGKAEENLVAEEAWPRDVDGLPAAGNLGPGWTSSYVGETSWARTASPYARSLTTYLSDDEVVSLKAGQTGLAGAAGGGAQSNPFTIDKAKTYEFSVYFKVDELDKHRVYFGLSGDVEWGRNIGADNPNPYVLSSNNMPSAANGYEADKWYKMVGYVLPDDSVQEGLGAYGGVYDTETGEKVQELEHFVWDASRTLTTSSIRFFNFNDESTTGQFTHFFQPEVREVIDTSYMLREGDRLNTWQDSKFIGATYLEGNSPVAPYDQDGETRWTEVQGPDGETAVVLEAGEFDGAADGGGSFTNTLTIDTSKTYRYVQYFRKSDIDSQSLNIGVLDRRAGTGATAGMKRVSSGIETYYGYFVNGGHGPSGWQQNLVEDEWYMAVGYFFADGALPTGAADMGGIYRVSDGSKVTAINTENHQWTSSVSSFEGQGLFFTHDGTSQLGWTTQFGAPTFGVIDDADLSSYEADPFGKSTRWYGETVTITSGQITAGVTDSDNLISDLRWALDPDGQPQNGEVVSVDELTGEVEYRPFAGALGLDSFSLVAIDPDGNQTVVPIEVELTLGNVNQAPVVPPQGYRIELAENSAGNGIIIGVLTATDPGEAIEYLFDKSLMVTMDNKNWTFSEDRQFKMNAANGHVFHNEGIFDYESGPQSMIYDVRVRNRFGSTDSRSAFTTLEIAIADVDELHTLTDASVDVLHFPTALGPLVPVPDEDGFAINLSKLMLNDPEGQTLSWSIVGGTANHPFTLGIDGVLYQTGSATGATTYSLTVEAEDALGRKVSGVLSVATIGTNTENPDVPVNQPNDNDDDDYGDFIEIIDPLFDIPPVVLDLDGDGVELLSINAGVRFDMDANGTLDRTGWFSPDDGILAYDENGNGVVDNGNEINFQRFVEGAFSDLEGLAFFDTNGNGLFDTADSEWGSFVLWQDTNSDGVSQADELSTLDAAGITSINLTGQQTGAMPDGRDNTLYATSSYRTADGNTGQVGDVFFVFDPATEDDGGFPVGDDASPPPTSEGGDTPGQQEDQFPGPDGSGADAPSFEFGSLSYGTKSKRYQLTSRSGSLFVGPRGTGAIMDQRAGAIAGPSYFAFRNRTFGMLSAVVLDLDGDGIETRRYKKTRAAFDMNGDGSRDNVGWTTSNDGFLVIDRNGNGVVDDGTEMAFLDSTGALQVGQAGLLALDTNSDGLVDSNDELFDQLTVWVDANRNGVTDIGEMQLLSSRGIGSISLSFAAVDETKRFGRNLTLSTTVFTRVDGSTGTAGDVAFGFVPEEAASQTLPGMLSGLSDGMSNLAGLPIEDISIDDLLGKWNEGLNVRDGDNPYVGLPSGPIPLPAHNAVPREQVAMNTQTSDSDATETDSQFYDVKDAEVASKIALLRQELAAFGGRTSMDEIYERQNSANSPYDFFA